MDSMACNKGQPAVRKPKKKQVKDELDRLKQAEKKRRRLEKALATSAAIISELEKKKQKKKEEQQRLDEEGATIAEAVALHVLLGEDADDPCEVVINKNGCDPFDGNGNVNLIMASRSSCFPVLDNGTYSGKGMSWFSAAYRSNSQWSGLENGEWQFPSGPVEKDLYLPFYADAGWDASGISAELIAAQAVSSLQIVDNARDDQVVVKRMLRRKP